MTGRFTMLNYCHIMGPGSYYPDYNIATQADPLSCNAVGFKPTEFVTYSLLLYDTFSRPANSFLASSGFSFPTSLSHPQP